jgi:hypothetical protein
METHGRSMRFAGGTLGRGHHICAFFSSIDRGDQAVHLADPEQREAHLRRLAGYPQTSFLAQMERVLVDLPGVEDLIEFEARVNYVVPKYDAAVACAYDLSKFGASVVMDALRTHPTVICGGLLHENPFVVSPDQFLLELRERRSARENASVAL